MGHGGQYQATGEQIARRRARVLAVDFSAWKMAWDLERLEPNTFFPVPASVVFAARGLGEDGKRGISRLQVRSNAGWARPARRDVRTLTDRLAPPYTDTSSNSVSPYDQLLPGRERMIVPRRLFFVEETENPCHSPGRPDGHREIPETWLPG